MYELKDPLSREEAIRVLFVLDKSGFGGVQSIAASLMERNMPGIDWLCFFLRNVNHDFGLTDITRDNVIYSRSRLKYELWSFIELCQIISERKIQVVHLNGNKSTFYGYLLKKFYPPLKIINHDHSGEFDYCGWFARFIKFSSKSFDRFLCVSDRRRKFLVEQCAVDPSKTVLLNNFVDERRFLMHSQKAGETADRQEHFVIGFVGRLSRVKGCDLLIKALPLLIKKIPGLKVHIVGTGPEQQGLERMTRQLKVDSYVKFYGFMENPAEAYRDFDIMVIPSRAEEGPICLYEAWMMGVPVVASDAPVINERIRDRDTGLLFCSEGVAELAARVQELHADQSLRGRLSENGLIEARSLTAEEYVHRLAEIYRSVI